LELIRNAPSDRQIIQGYRKVFLVSGTRYDHPIVVMPDRTVAWTGAVAGEIEPQTLLDILRAAAIEVCLIGCGARPTPMVADLRDAFRASHIGLDLMETGAACRTYNVLAMEGRRVAAALLPLQTQA
jgi:uncharacterized protein